MSPTRRGDSDQPKKRPSVRDKGRVIKVDTARFRPVEDESVQTGANDAAVREEPGAQFEKTAESHIDIQQEKPLVSESSRGYQPIAADGNSSRFAPIEDDLSDQGNSDESEEQRGVEEQSDSGAPHRRSVAAEKPDKKKLSAPAIVALVFLGVVVVALAALCFARWGAHNDNADIQGEWYVPGTPGVITVSGDTMKLSDDVSFTYSLDTQVKTIDFSFARFLGNGHYRFSADRDQLAVMEGGNYTLFGTWWDDLCWAVQNWFASWTGGTVLPPNEGPGAEQAGTLLVRVGSQAAAEAEQRLIDEKNRLAAEAQATADAQKAAQEEAEAQALAAAEAEARAKRAAEIAAREAAEAQAAADAQKEASSKTPKSSGEGETSNGEQPSDSTDQSSGQ